MYLSLEVLTFFSAVYNYTSSSVLLKRDKVRQKNLTTTRRCSSQLTPDLSDAEC